MQHVLSAPKNVLRFRSLQFVKFCNEIDCISSYKNTVLPVELDHIGYIFETDMVGLSRMAQPFLLSALAETSVGCTLMTSHCPGLQWHSKILLFILCTCRL